MGDLEKGPNDLVEDVIWLRNAEVLNLIDNPVAKSSEKLLADRVVLEVRDTRRSFWDTIDYSMNLVCEVIKIISATATTSLMALLVEVLKLRDPKILVILHEDS